MPQTRNVTGYTCTRDSLRYILQNVIGAAIYNVTFDTFRLICSDTNIFRASYNLIGLCKGRADVTINGLPRLKNGTG
jgi:hypothetical protein